MDKESLSNLPFHNFQLKWKKPHLKFLLAYNFLVTLIILVDVILVDSQKVVSKGTWQHLLYIFFSTIFALGFLFYYCYCAFKIFKDYRELIKPKRLKYLQSGLSCSFVSFVFLSVSLTTSATVQEQTSSIVTWTLFSLSIVTGIMSIVWITMYEFCYNFDIFYSKNKEKIIEAHLDYASKQKITQESETTNKKENEEIEE